MKLTCCFIPENAKQEAKEIIAYLKYRLLPPVAKFDDEDDCYNELLVIRGCKAAAEWQIWFGPTPDDNTLACTAHVGELLDPGAENRVFRVKVVEKQEQADE